MKTELLSVSVIGIWLYFSLGSFSAISGRGPLDNPDASMTTATNALAISLYLTCYTAAFTGLVGLGSFHFGHPCLSSLSLTVTDL